MSLTLGLNTALSGLQTNQRALDTVSQNISNVNTEGYTRKILNTESRVVDGKGAGVQVAGVQRKVSESLMKELRTQGADLGNLGVQQEIFPQIEDLFGQVSDNNSIAHQVTSFIKTYSDLGSDPNNASNQWSVVQSGLDMSHKLEGMTTKLQDLRLQSDRDIETKVNLINQDLTDIHDLNKKIVKYGALATGTSDLEDQRDQKMNDLSQLIDIQYYKREDGSMTVFTGSGQLLLDNQPEVVQYSATSAVDAWMTSEGGQFRHITIKGGSQNLDDQIRSGEIRGCLDMRDSTIPNLQAEIDQLSGKLKSMVNQVNNAGTSQPNVTTGYTGTRTFGVQSNFGSGQQVSITGSSDVMMLTFDSSGNQAASTSIKSIMSDANLGSGPWKINDLASTMQSWLRNTAGCSNAVVKLNDDGHFVVNTGTTNTTLCFRDQVSGTAGDSAADATIGFDNNGDGAIDETVQGFSNFFGLNDLMTRQGQNSIVDSDVQNAGFTTDTARDISLYDTTGQLGTKIIVPRNSSLSDIASAINQRARSTDSSALNSTPLQLSTNATISISDPSGLQFPAITLNGGTSYTLSDIAAALNSAASAGGNNAFTASVVQDGANSRLRLTDDRGHPLAATISGGLLTGSSLDLSQTLAMTAKQQVSASVVNSGSGSFLRLRQGDNRELYVSSTQDGNGKNLVSDLGLTTSDAGLAGMLDVRKDIQGSPSMISRGVVQYDTDKSEYYLSSGDNATALKMATVLNQKTDMRTAGDIYAGGYSLEQYAASSISVIAAKSADSKQKHDYESTLNDSLKNQNSAYSGVNLDEEVASLTEYQQAYAASAKVISTLQEMLQVLTDIIK